MEEPVNISVEADIMIPDTEEMFVVEVTVPKLDTEYKERVVKALFEKVEESEATEDDDIHQYIGQRNGITYELWFSDYYGETGWDINAQWFNFSAKNYDEIRPAGYTEYTGYMVHPYMTCDKYIEVGENECDISQEEAENLARELLEDLEIECPVLSYSKPLMWGDETISHTNIYNWPANGYVFNFEYGMGEVSFTGFGTNYDYLNVINSREDEVPQYSMYASAEVHVTDTGVIGLYVYSPVETVAMSESVELLPLNTIKEIMKSEMKKRYEDFRFVQVLEGSQLEFTHMELIYFRVSDKENTEHYSYVPAWRLSEQMGDAALNNREIRNPVVINAIDGSVINIYDEM